jgi:hypothetical protein
MTASGHSRDFDGLRMTSDLPPEADIAGQCPLWLRGSASAGGMAARGGLQSTVKIFGGRGDRATAPIEDIWGEKIRGCSYSIRSVCFRAFA